MHEGGGKVLSIACTADFDMLYLSARVMMYVPTVAPAMSPASKHGNICWVCREQHSRMEASDGDAGALFRRHDEPSRMHMQLM
jgi:hypothetical protein